MYVGSEKTKSIGMVSAKQTRDWFEQGFRAPVKAKSKGYQGLDLFRAIKMKRVTSSSNRTACKFKKDNFRRNMTAIETGFIRILCTEKV